VGVKIHIPYLLGAWGVITINFGKCVSQASKPIVWEITTILYIQFFGMNKKHREEKESLELEKPWRV
jgi:hypothetical protein